ncbi:hypothetical protein BST81_16635 [Leptolyngbya sp. 'hensonii']|uniref:hypothetical protein n=1 Tax=Leptolyngbya sp. 'hensonii' TaxID=1922337 RepID=UPI00094FEB5F|nr:hypothetical protein [Leptolyngbya sp. 'hensonii']OLP17418.1 hypothetical protein BST81_16635 [Leptolyngbya sp. 'hensonii']
MAETVVEQPAATPVATEKKPQAAPSKERAAASSKRMVFVTGDKGGVGKSCFARFLLDVYRTRNIPCRAFDSDTANPDLYRYYKNLPPGVERVDFTNRGQSDFLIDILPAQKDMILVDLPARAQADLTTFIREVRLTEQAKRFGFRVTFCSVISKERTSVVVLQELVEMCGNSVDYVVVKNLCHGESNQFHRYNESEVHKHMAKLGGVEINMKELFYTSWDAIADQDLPFRFAANTEKSPLTITQTARTATWLEEMETAIAPAHPFLGL